jgi:ADP-heptose:LPS heptosyltransferase/SAM-dependent methyltransferase
MVWRIDGPQGNEAGKVKWDVVPFTRGVGADVGCGPSKAFPHMIGVDDCTDTALFNIPIKPDLDAKALDLPFKDASLDFIFSSHLLEHIEDTDAAIREWWRCIKDGGYLTLYLPHRDLYPNVGEHGANPDHKHDFTSDHVAMALDRVVGDAWTLVVDEDRDQGDEYSFLFVAQKGRTASPPQAWRGHWALADDAHAAGQKTVCVVRYGGFGDQIQASNILPALKRAGYHVTFMTTPKGQDILRHDPHVDQWFIQDPDQVPNHELVEFWKYHQRRFDRFINLSESIEGTLLALPGRASHAWPDALRRRELDKNYLEWTADIAELPYTSEARFYPSDNERDMARAHKARMHYDSQRSPRFMEQPEPGQTLLWVLSGSSVHKFYPGQDVVISNLLKAVPDLRIMFSGDHACTILEAGWEKHPRVFCMSGELAIRDTLALAQIVDVVVGPETGVLNAVAFEPNGKVVLLSHSSPNNLTKHWVNTRAVVPFATPCYPCHRLHYTREFCPEDMVTGAAACQASIAPAVVFEAIMDALGEPFAASGPQHSIKIARAES